jgi:hypothetical protein
VSEFPGSDYPPLGSVIRRSFEQIDISKATADPRSGVETVLGQVASNLDLRLDASAVDELSQIIATVTDRMQGANPDAKDYRNGLDNLQSLLVISILLAYRRDSPTLDGATIQVAYRLACPVYPCLD